MEIVSLVIWDPKFADYDTEKQCLKNDSASFPNGQSEADPRPIHVRRSSSQGRHDSKSITSLLSSFQSN